jgi:2-C-methyl-D-erythritol 4-phosphate cytidylyltransferase/2-C-methyl-D-erythritol 2,4-cyclodiphosphate synthase
MPLPARARDDRRDRDPHHRGLAGHSDADVVLHSITDALLGAAGLATSASISRRPTRSGRARTAAFSWPRAKLVRAGGGIIDSVDCTVICEAPKIGPHRDAAGRVSR